MTSIDDVRSIDVFGRDGLRLRADEFGDPDGPAVVLLHGGGQTRFAWGSTARVLAERGWHVYRVDLRGHGESDWPDDGDYGPEAFAGDVYEIARSFPWHMAVTRSLLYAPFSAVPPSTSFELVRTVIAPITPGGPAAPAAPVGPAGPCGPVGPAGS